MWQKFVQPTHFKVYIAANSEAHKEPYVHTTTSSWFTLCLLWNTSKLKFWTLHKYVAVASGTEECLVLYEVLTLLDPYTYHQIIFFPLWFFMKIKSSGLSTYYAHTFKAQRPLPLSEKIERKKMMNWNQSSKLSTTKKRHFSSNSIDPYCSLIIGNLFRFDLSWT